MAWGPSWLLVSSLLELLTSRLARVANRMSILQWSEQEKREKMKEGKRDRHRKVEEEYNENTATKCLYNLTLKVMSNHFYSIVTELLILKNIKSCKLIIVSHVSSCFLQIKWRFDVYPKINIINIHTENRNLNTEIIDI